MEKVTLRQATIWDELERELPPALREVQAFLDVIDIDDLVTDLEKERGHGRDDYPVRAMLKLVLVQPYLRHGKFSQLLGELKRNGDLARLLGFNEIGPNHYQTPDASAMSRFHTKLKEPRYLERFEFLLKATVQLLKLEEPELGKHSALDTSDVRTHGKPTRKGQDGQERPSSDSAASWSVKTKRWEDGQGVVREETKSTFGYKAGFCVDTEVPAVLSVKTVTGKAPDHDLALPLLDAAAENVGKGGIETCAMDKAFDSEENIKGAHARGIAGIIPIRDVPKNLQELPPEDRELVVVGNIVRDRYSGEVACYEARGKDKPERRVMVYGGFEADRESHKFRCPLGVAAEGCCSAFATCGAGSCGKNGRQVRITMETDPRRFAPVYPGSKRWQRLYNGRSAVERVNSYVKEVLRLEDHCLRGKAAISLRVLLAAVTLNVRTLLALRAAKQEEKVRSAA